MKITISESWGGVLLNIVLTVASAAMYGYTIALLWGWFMVSAFGLPKLPFVVAIIIVLVCAYLLGSSGFVEISQDADNRRWLERLVEKLLKRFALPLINSLIMTFFGWVLQFFM